MQIRSTTCNSNQQLNNETYQCECKNYRTREKDYSWNTSICICENGKDLKALTMIQKFCVITYAIFSLRFF